MSPSQSLLPEPSLVFSSKRWSPFGWALFAAAGTWIAVLALLHGYPEQTFATVKTVTGTRPIIISPLGRYITSQPAIATQKPADVSDKLRQSQTFFGEVDGNPALTNGPSAMLVTAMAGLLAATIAFITQALRGHQITPYFSMAASHGITVLHSTTDDKVIQESVTPPSAEEPLRTYPQVDLSSSLPIIILPGLGNCTEDYDSLKAALQKRGAKRVEVLPVSRLDWLRNAAGLTDPAYWKGELEPRPILDWFLDRIDTLLQEMGEDVAVIGHSAGGWLARVYLGAELEHPNKRFVKKLVTLGTPHLPADPSSGAPDQTRGLLNYITREYPGAFHPEIEYVCVAGKHRKGAFFWDDPNKDPDCNGTRVEKFVVGAGYWTVCGTLEVWGDSIVPVQSALLPDAKQIVLQGVYHSPLGDETRAREWYGSEDNIDKWAECLV